MEILRKNINTICIIIFYERSQQRGNIPGSPKSPREDIQETYLGLDDGQQLCSRGNGSPSAS